MLRKRQFVLFSTFLDVRRTVLIFRKETFVAGIHDTRVARPMLNRRNAKSHRGSEFGQNISGVIEEQQESRGSRHGCLLVDVLRLSKPIHSFSSLGEELLEQMRTFNANLDFDQLSMAKMTQMLTLLSS